MKIRWMVIPVALLAAVVAGAVLAPRHSAAYAQGKRGESQLRTVRGQVIDKDENPLASGVVYLKNTKTMTVKTYIADETGQYRFSGLDPNVDYEIHAEHQNSTSGKKTVSTYDSRKEIVINLKVDKRKEGS